MAKAQWNMRMESNSFPGNTYAEVDELYSAWAEGALQFGVQQRAETWSLLVSFVHCVLACWAPAGHSH